VANIIFQGDFMKKALLNALAAAAFSLLLLIQPARAQEQTTTENFIASTELLLISQANLAILALDLISTNM
jgi:hypothetical protein